MPLVDLEVTSLRSLNQLLHGLEEGTNDSYFRVVNPRGRHSVAVGLDQPVTVEIDGNVGYYCAAMNAHATVIVNGSAGVGLAENMMSGRIHVKGDASASAGATGCGGLLIIDGNAAGTLRHLGPRHRHRGQGLGRAYVGLHGASRQPRRAWRCRRSARRFDL